MESVAADVGAKASTALLHEHRREMKLKQLKKEAKAAERRAAQKKRIVKEESQKRLSAKVTIHLYFTTMRNPDNKGDLDQLQGCENNLALRHKHRQGHRVNPRRGAFAHIGVKTMLLWQACWILSGVLLRL